MKFSVVIFLGIALLSVATSAPSGPPPPLTVVPPPLSAVLGGPLPVAPVPSHVVKVQHPLLLDDPDYSESDECDYDPGFWPEGPPPGLPPHPGSMPGLPPPPGTMPGPCGFPDDSDEYDDSDYWEYWEVESGDLKPGHPACSFIRPPPPECGPPLATVIGTLVPVHPPPIPAPLPEPFNPLPEPVHPLPEPAPLPEPVHPLPEPEYLPPPPVDTDIDIARPPHPVPDLTEPLPIVPEVNAGALDLVVPESHSGGILPDLPPAGLEDLLPPGDPLVSDAVIVQDPVGVNNLPVSEVVFGDTPVAAPDPLMIDNPIQFDVRVSSGRSLSALAGRMPDAAPVDPSQSTDDAVVSRPRMSIPRPPPVGELFMKNRITTDIPSVQRQGHRAPLLPPVTKFFGTPDPDSGSS